MLALRHIGAAASAVVFVLATAAIDSAEARRGGGGGMRGGAGSVAVAVCAPAGTPASPRRFPRCEPASTAADEPTSGRDGF